MSLETQAKLQVQEEIRTGKHELVWSSIEDYENAQNPFEIRRDAISQWRTLAVKIQMADTQVVQNAKIIMQKGIKNKDALHIASVQISFRRESIVKNCILFDPEMGAGTGHGCGEENKFLFDCLHKHLRIIHVPITIASLASGGESHWFNGWTQRFFIERGWATARFLGKPLAVVYAAYYAVVKRKAYKNEIGMGKAFSCMVKGIFKGNNIEVDPR